MVDCFVHVADAVGFLASCFGVYQLVEMLKSKYKKPKDDGKEET
jgi:hypothetical protein